jgi:hypothetical protein
MKVTLEHIHSKIKNEVYLVLPDGRTTVCQLTLENGYSINGVSACVDANEFNLNIGRKIAFEDAVRQIWPLEGYLLAESIFQQGNFGLSKASLDIEIQKQFNNELRKMADKKPHWTQTPEGKKKMAARKRLGKK